MPGTELWAPNYGEKHPDHREKDRIIDGHLEITTRGGFGWSRDEVEQAANIPRNRPFFRGIMTEDEGRIYVKKVQSVLVEGGDIEYDIFSRDGYYLYSARLPFDPMDIKAGYLYSTGESEETGEVRVIRYRIKNWSQIRAGI